MNHDAVGSKTHTPTPATTAHAVRVFPLEKIAACVNEKPSAAELNQVALLVLVGLAVVAFAVLFDSSTLVSLLQLPVS